MTADRMIARRYSIREQTLDIEVDSEALALMLQPRISDINRRRFLPVIERVLNELAVPGQQIRIARLDVDLGELSLDDFEQAAEASLYRELHRALEKAVREAMQSPSAEKRALPEAAALIDTLDHYLTRGTLPFAAQGEGFSAEAIVVELAESEPAGLVAMMRRHARNQDALQRIVIQLGEAALVRLLQLLTPEHAALILAYMIDLKQIHRVEPLLSLADEAFGRLLWVLVLSYVMRDAGTQFNRTSFVRSLLEDIAESQLLDYADLIATLRRGLTETEKRHSLASSLPSVIQELLREPQPGEQVSTDARNIEGVHEAAAVEATQDGLRAAELALLDRYLVHGTLPLSGRRGSTSAVEELLLRLLESDPEGLRELLRAHGREASAVRRIVDSLGEALLQRLLGVLEPGHAALIAADMIDLRRVQEVESLLRLDDKEFARLLWILVLSYVLRDPSSQFNRKSFIRSLLEQMARSEAREYLDLVAALGRILDKAEEHLAPASSLLAVVRELLREADLTADAWATGGVAHVVHEAIIWLEQYLITGEISREVEAAMGARSPHALLRLAMAQDAAEALDLIRRLARRSERQLEAVTSRLLNAVAPAELLAILAPTQQTGILERIERMSRAERTTTGVAPEAARADNVWSAAFEYLLGRPSGPLDLDAMMRDTQATAAKRADAGIRTPDEGNGTAFAVDDQIEILRYYLRHGVLPWSAALRDSGLSVETALASLARLSTAQLRAIFAGESTEREARLSRVVHALGEAKAVELILQLVPPPRAHDGQLASALTAFADRAGDRRRFYVRALAAVLDGGAVDLDTLADVALADESFAEGRDASELRVCEAHALKSALIDRLRRDDSPAAEEPSAGELLRVLVAAYPDDARLFLREFADQAARRTALLRQIPPALLRSASEMMSPAMAPTLRAFFRALATLPPLLHPRLKEREEVALTFGALLLWLKDGSATRLFAQLLRDVFEAPVPDEVRQLLSSRAAAWRASGELPTAHIAALKAALAGPAEADSGDGTRSASPRTSDALQADVFAFLLGDGSASAAAGETSTLSEDTLLHALRRMLEDGKEELIHFVREHAIERAQRERWAKVLPPSALARLTQLIEPRQHRTLLAATELLASALEEMTRHPSVGRAALWSFVFDFIAEHASIDRTRDRLVAAFLARFVGAGEPLATEFLEHAGRLAHAAGQNALVAILRRDHAARLASREHAPSATIAIRAVEARELPQPVRAPHRPLRSKTAFELASEKIARQGEPIYINNAGLILTSPFLPHLFETLDLVERDDNDRPRIRAPDALSRAVHLLQYLVDGRTSAPEPLLVLNKILCGVPPETPIARKIEPTDAEQELCQRLLASMLANWTAISSTSIAGLRETFLQREGKLQRSADSFKLRVQRKTLDVLVDQIPWSISMSYLPWMPQPLLVTW